LFSKYYFPKYNYLANLTREWLSRNRICLIFWGVLWSTCVISLFS